METVTKSEMQSYEDCRTSGVTNMFDARVVESITGLPRTKLLIIMKNYSELMAKYQIKRKIQ